MNYGSSTSTELIEQLVQRDGQLFVGVIIALGYRFPEACDFVRPEHFTGCLRADGAQGFWREIQLIDRG